MVIWNISVATEDQDVANFLYYRIMQKKLSSLVLLKKALQNRAKRRVSKNVKDTINN